MTKRNKYSPEFKTEAINMVLNEGKSTDEVGKSLGVHPTSIRNWVTKYKENGTQSFTGNGNKTPAEKEISRLLKENKELKQERDILKKATAYFAKEIL
jgi:transposase